MVQAIIHSPIHLGPFNIWHKHGLHKRLWLTCRWQQTLWALYFHLLIWALRNLRNHWTFLLKLVSITWAEFVVAVGILGLWEPGHRAHSSRYNKIKQYISGTSWKQACKTANHCDDTGNTGFHIGRLWETVLFFAGLWILGSQAISKWNMKKTYSCKLKLKTLNFTLLHI